MSLLKKILVVFFLLFQISSSFAEMVTFNQRVTVNEVGETDKGGTGSDDADWGIAAGIEFNPDGTKMFVSFSQNFDGTGEIDPLIINTYNLSIPYDISTSTYAGDGQRCTFDRDVGQLTNHRLYDLEISNDGMKMLAVTRNAKANADDDHAYVLSLTSPYDISSCQRSSTTTDIDSDAFLLGSNAGRTSNLSKNRLEGIEINEDGSKLFLLFMDNTASDDVGGRIYEFNLSTPFDLSSSSMSLVLDAGIILSEDTSTGVHGPASMRFSANGKRLFVTSHAPGGTKRVTQISLTNAYDTSSFVIDGNYDLSNASYNNSQPRGIAFNSSGLKMYLTKDRSGNPNAGLDQVLEYDLVCPFNIIAGKCPSITENKDRTGMAIAQIEIAKRNIDHSTNSALNRLKWIRRNKDKQNLTNLNIDFNFDNQRLASLTEVVRTSAVKKKAKDKDEKRDVFYWSEGSIAIGRVGDTRISSTKEINTNRITVGADRFIDDKALRGLAFSVGRSNVDVGNKGSNVDADTYNLTYYSTSPMKDDKKFVDTIIGIGKIRSDILTVLDSKELTANRKGKQIFGTIRIKDEIKGDKFTLIPSGRFDIGHTLLDDYEEIGVGGIIVEKQHIRTKNLRASLSAVEDVSNDKYTIKRHGKIEYRADIDRSSDFKYKYKEGSSAFNDTLHVGALHNITGELGIDIVFPENYSIFIIYERDQAIDYGHTDNLHIAIGYLPNKNTNYSIQLDSIDNTKSNYVISKNINDFLIDFKLTNHLMRPDDYEEASFNLRRKF